MRFIELPIESDPKTKEPQTFSWRNRKGLIKTHSHWAQAPDRQQFLFTGTEIVKVEQLGSQ